jgi:hypothetical protein
VLNMAVFARLFRLDNRHGGRPVVGIASGGYLCAVPKFIYFAVQRSRRGRRVSYDESESRIPLESGSYTMLERRINQDSYLVRGLCIQFDADGEEGPLTLTARPIENLPT